MEHTTTQMAIAGVIVILLLILCFWRTYKYKAAEPERFSSNAMISNLSQSLPFVGIGTALAKKN